MEDVYGKYAEALRAGHQFAASGQLKEALKCYRLATELAGERALPHVALGGTLLRLNQPRQALAAYERALELEPNLAEAHLAMGDVKRMVDWDWDGAEQAYRQAIALNPSQGIIYPGLANV